MPFSHHFNLPLSDKLICWYQASTSSPMSIQPHHGYIWCVVSLGERSFLCRTSSKKSWISRTIWASTCSNLDTKEVIKHWGNTHNRRKHQPRRGIIQRHNIWWHRPPRSDLSTWEFVHITWWEHYFRDWYQPCFWIQIYSFSLSIDGTCTACYVFNLFPTFTTWCDWRVRTGELYYSNYYLYIRPHNPEMGISTNIGSSTNW